MTTAARPTFDPAKGKDNSNPSAQTSARDIASHTKIKYRKDGQKEDYEGADEDDFKNRLLAAEREHLKLQGKLVDDPASPSLMTPEQQALIDHFESGKAQSEVHDGDEEEEEEGELGPQAQVEDEDDEEYDDEDDDDEEDTEALMKELEKIKKERAEAKLRQEKEQKEQDLKREEEVLKGNPLLNDSGNQDFTVKRRWDDDVIFKNQARGSEDPTKKRFVNDMLRSDFHRKFMDKYIR